MGLFRTKEKRTYVRFLRWLTAMYRQAFPFQNDANDEINDPLLPRTIQSDFEAGWISAVQEVFPSAAVSLCMVHLGLIQK